MMSYSLSLKLVSEYAEIAHQGQKRKYSGEPYINHPREVARIVAKVGGSKEMIAAALLHDVVEDCEGYNLIEISKHFGPEVSMLVGWLTDVSRPEDGNRLARKAMDREHSGRATPAAKTIKMADLISNTRSIVVEDPNFAKIYMAEKALLLPLLKDGDRILWHVAEGLCIAYKTGVAITDADFQHGGIYEDVL